jgi:hypothetical protein
MIFSELLITHQNLIIVSSLHSKIRKKIPFECIIELCIWNKDTTKLHNSAMSEMLAAFKALKTSLV